MSLRIAFVGTGVMGTSMAGHLLKAGHDVTVFTRTRFTRYFPCGEITAAFSPVPPTSVD